MPGHSRINYILYTKLYGRCFLSVWISVLCLATLSVKAQPCFTADITRGCAPLTIHVTDCSTDGSEIGYDFGEGITAVTTYTFTTPGKYTLRQVGNFTASGGGDTLTRTDYIEVLPTPAPVFSVSSCRGNTVNVKITEPVYDAYIVNFGDGSTQTIAPNDNINHTYATIAQQTITVTGHYNIQPNPPGGVCGNSGSQTITPIQELVKPLIKRLEVKNAAEVELSFETLSYLSYTIYQKTGSGAYQEIADLPAPPDGTTIQSIANVNTGQAVYTFRVDAKDICNNTVSSEEVSSILLNGSAANNQNELSWQQATTLFQQFSIQRDNQTISEISVPARRNYTDQQVKCPNEYCYRLLGQTASGIVSVSNQVCIQAISSTKPPAIRNMTVSIENGIPVVSWPMPPGISAALFTIFRSDNGGPFRELERTNDAVYRDENSNAQVNLNDYCYQVVYSDACGNTSLPGDKACPIRLSGTLNSTIIQLNWNPYTGWTNGVKSYTLEKLDAQGNVNASQNANTSVSATIDLNQEPDNATQVLRFRLKALPNEALVQPGYSNSIEIIQAQQLHLPEAFTPNNDKLNDTFEAKGLFIQEFTMTIYNRWGEILFVSDDINNGWDGTFNGERSAAGSYVYTIQTGDFTGRTYKRKGTFVLIR